MGRTPSYRGLKVPAAAAPGTLRGQGLSTLPTQPGQPELTSPALGLCVKAGRRKCSPWPGGRPSGVVVGSPTSSYSERRGSDVQADEEDKPLSISVVESEDKIFLKCNGTEFSWMDLEESSNKSHLGNKSVDLGKKIQDPRGIYQCSDNKDKKSVLQVYYRMCQNCVEVKSSSLIGILIADIIATVFLAVGVYCFAGHEEGYLSADFDKQILMQNDELYQPLRDRDDNSYSHIGGKRPQNKCLLGFYLAPEKGMGNMLVLSCF
uniref:T-cell surface glycoprotein CD3 delta chain n=1 Tax=Monodelphis domestica TaxID=13616 RepID=A0A5F8GY82_MONDO